jgi:amino acid ABC transporter membrane protein 2, PAAT family (TC 3.A.1.3.-)
VGVLAWMRANLFSSWLNTLLTLFAVYLVWLIVPPLVQWALIDANWVGTTRADCTKEGACWVFVQQRFGQFMYGYYPVELRWRVDLTVWLAVLGAAPLFIKRFRARPPTAWASWCCTRFWLTPAAWGLPGPGKRTDQPVGGLMLTLVIAPWASSVPCHWASSLPLDGVRGCRR